MADGDFLSESHMLPVIWKDALDIKAQWTRRWEPLTVSGTSGPGPGQPPREARLPEQAARRESRCSVFLDDSSELGNYKDSSVLTHSDQPLRH